jgi:ankyrin repeat protein
VSQLLDLAPGLANARDPACDVAPVTPLTHAVFAGQREVARLLLERGARVEPNGVRLVEAAAERGDEALTDLLLAHGAEAGALGAGGWVLYPGIAAKLVARGADVNREPGAWIGLCCTGNSGHRENVALVRGMLRCGADVAARYNGRTALHCAAKAGFAAVTAALIEAGADVNALDDRGRTPLAEVEQAGPSVDREPVRRLLIAKSGRRGG